MCACTVNVQELAGRCRLVWDGDTVNGKLGFKIGLLPRGWAD